MPASETETEPRALTQSSSSTLAVRALRHLPTSTLGWLLVLAPPALELWCIWIYGVNTLIWDEWDLVPFLREVHEGGDWWSWLFRQHNEHRVAALRLPLAVIAEWSDWNVIPEMLLGFAVQLVTLLGLWRILAPRLDHDPLRFAPVSALLFGLIGYQVFLYGMMFVWSILVATTVWSAWWLARRSWGGLAAAATSGSIASFTLTNGLFVWPLGLVLLILGRDRWARRIAWAAIGIAVWGLYFWGYVTPAHHPSLGEALGRPVALVGFFAATLGAPLGAGSFWASAGFGLCLLVLLAAAGPGWLRSWRGWTRSELTIFFLLTFGLFSTAAVSLSRLELGRGFALEPRYSFLTILVSVALYGYLFGRWREASARRRLLAAALAAALAAGYLGTSPYAFEQIVAWSQLRTSQRAQIYRIDELPDSALAGIYHDPARLRERAAYMRERGLGPFSEPFGELRMTEEWQLGVPSGEIVAGRSLVQRFRCPVPILHDLAVPFAVHPRPNRGRLELVLSEADEILGRKEFGTASLEPNEWVRLEAEEPIRDCHGRQLTLTIRTDDGALGSAVAAWTYPEYYEGELFQQGIGGLPGRSLGLEINRGGS